MNELIDKVMNDNPKAVELCKLGQDHAFRALIGQIYRYDKTQSAATLKQMIEAKL